MRILRVLPTLLLAALAVSVGVGPPAHGKGPTSVEVSGPGLDATALAYTKQRGDVDLYTLIKHTGIYGLSGAGRLVAEPELSEAELGPRYILSWHAGGMAMTGSHVYPFADGGAWVYHLYNRGGWFRGGPDLERAMVELGAEQPNAVPEVSTSSTAVGSSSTASGSQTEIEPIDSSSAVPVGGVAGLVSLVLLGGATAWWLRRRRTPRPG